MLVYNFRPAIEQDVHESILKFIFRKLLIRFRALFCTKLRTGTDQLPNRQMLPKIPEETKRNRCFLERIVALVRKSDR